MRGTVINVSSRYGFIRPDADEASERMADVYFSTPACWGVPRYGSRVEYDLMNSAKPRACNVKVIA